MDVAVVRFWGGALQLAGGEQAAADLGRSLGVPGYDGQTARWTGLTGWLRQGRQCRRDVSRDGGELRSG